MGVFYCPSPFFVRDSLPYRTLDVVYLANIQFYGIKKDFTRKKFSQTNNLRSHPTYE